MCILVGNVNESDKMYEKTLSTYKKDKKSGSLPDLPYSLRPPAKLRMPKMGGGGKRKRKQTKKKGDSLVEKQCILTASL